MGVIQGAVVDILKAAAEPLRPREVRVLVEELLNRPVSQDTVSSFLSVAARQPHLPIERTGPSLYIARKCD